MTRRRFVAVSGATVGAASVAGVMWPPVANSSGKQRGVGLTDAVLKAFRKHRLVGIGEGGIHGLQEHHDAITALLSDPRVAEVVDDVVVEFGNARHQRTIDDFTAGGAVDNPELRPAWRDTTQSPSQTWDQPVFEQFFRTVRAVNSTLRRDRRIRVLLGDPPIDWARTTTPAELQTWQLQRSSYPLSVVAREVLGKGRRALILYGDLHLLHRWHTPSNPAVGRSLVSAIEESTDERVHVIATLVPSAGDPGDLGKRLSQYERGTVVPTAGTWLGSFDAGVVYPFALRGSDGQPTNLTCGIPLSSLIDAGLYLGQPADLTVSRENPAGYLDPTYWAELRRRNEVGGGRADLDAYRHDQPVRFTPVELPPSLRCD